MTTITHLTKTAEMLGSGSLISPAAHRAQIDPLLIGFGHTTPTCAACGPNTVDRSYGLGVILRHRWVTISKSFAGSDASIADLPARKIAIAVQATYQPAAFDQDGNTTRLSRAPRSGAPRGGCRIRSRAGELGETVPRATKTAAPAGPSKVAALVSSRGVSLRSTRPLLGADS
jgi:hypothetical protein